MTTNSLLNASVALCNSNPADSVRTQAKYGAAQFWAFDIMMYQGEDVTLAHYIERKRLLRSVVEMLELQHPDCSIKYVPAYESSATVIQKMIDVGYEGAMLKSKTGAYQYGKRSPHWLKVKGFSTMDAFITGYEPGNGGFEGYVGSICFSVMNPDGTFFEAGKFGNLEFEVRALMSAEDGSLKPEYYGRVVEIMAQARTKTNRLRHAHLVRWRPDKEPQDCGLDQLDLIARA
jgi:bifunctional non-homologous end joining protein LigD